MIVAEIRRHTTGADGAEQGWETCLTLRADGHELALEGDERVLSLSIPVIEPTTGRQLRAADDAETWVRHLPGAFRAGDYAVVVVEDSDPLAPEELPADAATEVSELEIPPAEVGTHHAVH